MDLKQEKDNQSTQVAEVPNIEDGDGKGKKGRGKRARADDAGLDEKRLKFLERNRAAATRCREKKKHWMQELQQKANTLSVANSQMQAELAQLREEISQMKTILGGDKALPPELLSWNPAPDHS
eukprot:m.227144 g.227144  ORF g.227144 m.227144 type:complete len:124 (+) comp17127_c0_seq1:31-402(+)